MFAFERENDSSLVIGAGIPEAWVRESPGVRVRNLSTHYGRLSYTMRANGNSVQLHIEGVRIPPGGLIIRSPLDKSIKSASMDGHTVPSSSTEVIVRKLPASLDLRY